MASGELAVLAQLRALATHPAARGLADDAALLVTDGHPLILTHDTLVEGVHYLGSDPAEDVAWKLLAVNCSDLAAKGARPLAAVMSFALTGDEAWQVAFVRGLGEALAHFDVALIGGDTVGLPHGAPRVIGMTLIGQAGPVTPSRSGARVGDGVYVTGSIGDAGAGLRAAHGEIEAPILLSAYRRPQPQLAAGQALAPLVSAMMDISDGLLIDAQRLAEASDIGMRIDLDAVPLSAAYRAHIGDDHAARLAAVTAGDDYQLLFTLAAPPPPLACSVTRIGEVVDGAGIIVTERGAPIELPERLGWTHA